MDEGPYNGGPFFLSSCINLGTACPLWQGRHTLECGSQGQSGDAGGNDWQARSRSAFSQKGQQQWHGRPEQGESIYLCGTGDALYSGVFAFNQRLDFVINLKLHWRAT